VTSAVVRLRFRQAAVDVGDRRAFERIVRGIFLQRRKTLTNALRPSPMRSGSLPLNFLSERRLMDGCGPKRSRSTPSPAFRELCYSFSRKSLSFPVNRSFQRPELRESLPSPGRVPRTKKGGRTLSGPPGETLASE